MKNIDALVFDVFGTVVDWRSTVIKALVELGAKHGVAPDTDWEVFAQEWRSGYMKNTRRVAAGGQGSFNVDEMHREILEEMLRSSQWAHVGAVWDQSVRDELNLIWHRLDGWPDTNPGLHALKQHKILATLSNGNIRLLIDMAKHADLPWDVVFSTELFQVFKPNPKAYREAMRHLAVTPDRCAMVAAHIYDLRAAGSLGMTTIYVRRPNEETAPEVTWDGAGAVKSKAEGGEVDYVVDSFLELADIVKNSTI